MLSAYRVLDLTDYRSNLAGLLLAALGAEVIAIEPPGGSASRRMGPFIADQPGPERSLIHWSYNRGKKSVVLDVCNRALVHTSITAFGSEGPKANWAATDLILMAAAGVSMLAGDADRAP